MGKPNISVRSGSIRDQFIKRFGKPIEDFEAFKRATERLEESTFKTCRRILPYYFLYLEQTPDEVIAQRKLDMKNSDDDESERYERATALYVKSLIERGLSGNFVSNHLARVQGFFTNNGKRLSLDMGRQKISKARKRKKYSPTNEEVRILRSKADCSRDEFIVTLIYQNGPAPADVAKLCVGDYPSEPWQYFELTRSKTGEVWRGVSTPDVCACQKAYLNVRGKVRAGEPLFVSREGVLNNEGISTIVRNLIVKAEFGDNLGFKPTSLRDAFEDALVDAEIYHKVKEALMAHSSDIEHHYGGHNRMVAKLVEAMKRVYPLVCLTEYKVEGAVLNGLSVEQQRTLLMLGEVLNKDGVMGKFQKFLMEL